jgi:hypothetical protein
MNAQTSMTAAAIPFAAPPGRWDDAVAATLSLPKLLLYRTNVLGSDLTVTTFCFETLRPSWARSIRSPAKA